MNFTSDNAYGASPEILDALGAANTGAAPSYGDDAITAKLRARMAELFEHDVAVYPVVTGTAANALVLATLCPPHGAILCHAQAHIVVDECGAPEFFSQGAKLVPLDGRNGKLDPAAIEIALSRFPVGSVHNQQPSMISLTQATEAGTCYRLDEIAAIARVARKHGLKLHMDGARFANALAHLGCSPADATWRAGIDALSFGATKNGALCAEAVVFFNTGDVRDFEYRRKRAGHLPSKMRFVSAQLVSYLEDGRWLATAGRANGLARTLAKGLGEIDGAELAYPVEANAVFVFLPDNVAARLRAAGATFLDWAPPSGGRTLIRLVCSFATPEEHVARFLDVVRGPS
ncbi:MAG: low specificity L-threonine aldolase [Rhizomicrobium sp.]|jgi:threonine aldolase